ncbi:MAG: WYL domain-containing protein [Burkholderiaceae bacterium]
MGQTERLYKLKSWLDAGKCMSKAALLEQLGVSPATLKRDLAHLRDRMNAPIVFDRERGGWRLDRHAASVGTQYELPGLWFSAQEIHALLTMQHLLAHLDAGGLLRPHIAPLIERLDKALGAGSGASAEVARRIRVQTVGARKVHLPHFQAVGTALLQRRRLVIDYHGRSRNERREREVSPQRLIHYRDNWYLDAWCHVKRGLRSFALDAVQAARVLHSAAINVAEAQLDAVLGAGYGIFAGRKVQWATLRFTPERARWVAAETWHPKQRGRFEADGSYRLELPYADPRELVMDILRHVPEVEVVGPAGLREEVGAKLRAGVEKMGGRVTP